MSETTLDIPWTKLPMRFDTAPLLEELQHIDKIWWLQHPNARGYEGDWNAVALRSNTGRPNGLLAISDQTQYRDTVLMQECPRLAAVVRTFAFPLSSVRLMRLAAGSRIKEHTDDDLLLKNGQLRIHVPIVTNDKLVFVVDGRRLILREGETWYIDFSRPHWVYNGGETDRIHLVIDGVANDWAWELLERSSREIVTDTFDVPDETHG